MYTYNAILKRIVDGDTLDAYIDLGFDVSVTKRIRLMFIDAAESRTKFLEEKELGLAAKHRLYEIIEDNDGEFIIKSHGVGKYGRVLGELFITEFDDRSINDTLVMEGFAVPYDGGSKMEMDEKWDMLQRNRKMFLESRLE
jgi:micrococcal nuclease